MTKKQSKYTIKCPKCKKTIDQLHYKQVCNGTFYPDSDNFTSGDFTEDFDLAEEPHFYCPKCSEEVDLEKLY